MMRAHKKKICIAAFLAAAVLACCVPFAAADDPKTAAGLVAHVKAQVGQVYWYGGYGHSTTLDFLEQKRIMYPGQMTLSRYNSAKKNHVGSGKRAYDCSGLINSYWMQASPQTPATAADYRRKASYDQSAAGLWQICGLKKTGTIGTIPDTPGTLVFIRGKDGRMNHIGVYIGNGQVVEAKGFNYGVVKTQLKGNGWTHWGQLPASWLSY